MENIFKFLKQSSIIWKSEEFKENENDITKLFNMGLVVRENGRFKVNPLVSSAKSLSEAKSKLKSKVNSWLNHMDRLENIQDQFRKEMVEHFKNNPIEGNVMAIDTPEKYRNTKGYCYVINNKIISLHAGYRSPVNAPVGCDRFKYTSLLGYVEVHY